MSFRSGLVYFLIVIIVSLGHRGTQRWIREENSRKKGEGWGRVFVDQLSLGMISSITHKQPVFISYL